MAMLKTVYNRNEVLKSPIQWAVWIKKANNQDRQILMQDIMAVCIDKNGRLRPEYKQNFGFAFLSLVDIIYPDINILKNLKFPLSILEESTLITVASYRGSKKKQNILNLMLKVAEKMKENQWANFIYKYALFSNRVDAITCGTAMRIFGKAGQFEKAEEVYSKFKQIQDSSKICRESRERGYCIMLEGCFKNKKFERAMEVFNDAEKDKAVNPFMHVKMMRIYIHLDKRAEALHFMDELKNWPSVSANILEDAKRCISVISPDYKELSPDVEYRPNPISEGINSYRKKFFVDNTSSINQMLGKNSEIENDLNHTRAPSA